MENALIQLERKPAWADALRSYHIFLDGELVGTIRQGKVILLRFHQGTMNSF
jgi:hypothetical protein